MSGHSKWSTIKRKKAINDQARSHVFSKMSRLITIAVHTGGGIPDPDKNVQLRLAIDRAKAVNMPKDTIQRAIDKASGGEGSALKENVYEGFGPGGSFLLIETTTDNANRTYSEVKNVLEKNGGKMGALNSVAYMFDRCGVVEFEKSAMSEQDMLSFSENADALDIEESDTHYTVFIPFESIGRVEEYTSIRPETVDTYFKPKLPVELSEGDRQKLEKIISLLEDLDDVHNVHSNT